MDKAIRKSVAIILGGTFPHIELINNLKRRNYYTILIDFLNSPPAKKYADEHIIESTLDRELILQIAQGRNTELIISSCVDQANVTACYVAEKLNLPHPYSYETAKIISNKISMKKLMVEGEIQTSRFAEVDNLTMLNNHNLKFPLIIKPSDSNSSKGVRKAINKAELNEFADYAFSISRNKKVIVEEFIEGKEIGVDCYIENGDAKIIMTRERIKINDEHISTQQIIGAFWPANLTNKNLKAIKIIANKIAKIFQLNNTPLLMQVILH
jgi:formate-dependent phosphoribosylglycinamide formyltransferase (GAR transformylase)